MRFFTAYVKTTFIQGLTYKFNYFIELIGTLLFLLVQYFIWRALMGQELVSTDYGIISFSQMSTYIVISSIVEALLSSEIISEMSSKIKSGQIAMDLIKPVNIKGLLFCNSISGNIYRVVFHLLPITIISIFAFGINMPTIYNFLFFILTTINGIILYFLMGYILGILSFWFTEVWILNRFLNDLVRLFAGSLIPLWFFPSWLNKISQFLPLRLIYFTPISIFMNIYSSTEIWFLILQQLLWIGGLYFVGVKIWGKGISKLVVQGG